MSSQLLKRQRAVEGSGVATLTSQAGTTLVGLLAQPRFEIFPSAGVVERAARLPAGTRVTVTCSPRLGIDTTLKICKELSALGMRPVPHLSARLVIGNAHLERILQALADQKLRDIFVIGGDSQQPAGPFSSAYSLLNAIAASGYEPGRVGIAAYPEGHPLIDDASLLQALQDKQSFASYMVTQMCFDAGTIIEWIASVRRAGIHLPVEVGISGAFELQKLMSLALRIGVGESTRFLKKHTNLLGRVVRPKYSPTRLVSDLASGIAASGFRIQGFHIYTFNQIEETHRWREALLTHLSQASMRDKRQPGSVFY